MKNEDDMRGYNRAIRDVCAWLSEVYNDPRSTLRCICNTTLAEALRERIEQGVANGAAARAEKGANR